MAKLETQIRRYVGGSTEGKPMPAALGGEVDVLPPGSLYFEKDTGVLFRFDGYRWNAPPQPDAAQLRLLEEIRDGLASLNEYLRTLAEGVLS